MGKILRVDLTTGALRYENLPEEPILKKFIGGQALATYILLKELSLHATPFGPENIVVMMTGPLTGNRFSWRKMTAVSKPSHRRLSARGDERLLGDHLKRGNTGIILTGASKACLSLSTKCASCATPISGLRTRATEDRLREAVDTGKAKVVAPSRRENMNRAAMLANDYVTSPLQRRRGLGSHSSAIVVHGTVRVFVTRRSWSTPAGAGAKP
jgi:aldehyde:ferredoxin oxidoreductase